MGKNVLSLTFVGNRLFLGQMGIVSLLARWEFHELRIIVLSSWTLDQFPRPTCTLVSLPILAVGCWVLLFRNKACQWNIISHQEKHYCIHQQ